MMYTPILTHRSVSYGTLPTQTVSEPPSIERMMGTFKNVQCLAFKSGFLLLREDLGFPKIYP